MLSIFAQYAIEQAILSSPFKRFISERTEKRIWFDISCEHDWIETFTLEGGDCINCCLGFCNGDVVIRVLDACGNKINTLPVTDNPVSKLLQTYEHQAGVNASGEKYYRNKAEAVKEVIKLLSKEGVI